jgi:hypothetical protein
MRRALFAYMITESNGTKKLLLKDLTGEGESVKGFWPVNHSYFSIVRSQDNIITIAPFSAFVNKKIKHKKVEQTSPESISGKNPDPRLRPAKIHLPELSI